MSLAMPSPTRHRDQTLVAVVADITADKVALNISDDGPGIPAQALPQVFEKFIKADTLADGGRGIGLRIGNRQGIMEAHDGTIVAESPLSGRSRHAHYLDLSA